MLKWKRTLRTASSECFIATRDGQEVASVDLHFLTDGTVRGTVLLFAGSADNDGETITWREEEIPDLLASFDEDFLPSVDLSTANLTYTVVIGRLMGSFDIEPPSRM